MKKIRTKILLAFAASGLLLLPSCGDWLDINTNELASTKVEPGYLFNYAAVNYSGTRMGGDQYMSIAWPAQIISDGDYWYGGDDFYTISTYSTGNTWVSTYASVGNNLLKAIEFAKEAEDINAEAQCKILFAISVWGSTMIFGDIPYSEAWRIEEIKTPKFDPQKDILYALVDLVDEAIDLIDTSKESSITTYDIYYKGDMEKWLKLGKSLKLRLLLYLSNHEDVGSQIGALVTEDKLLASDADTFAFPYFDTAGNYNPNYALYEVYPHLTPIWNAANPTVIDPMLAVDDPRIPFYFDPAETDETLYKGIPPAGTISKTRRRRPLPGQRLDGRENQPEGLAPEPRFLLPARHPRRALLLCRTGAVPRRGLCPRPGRYEEQGDGQHALPGRHQGIVHQSRCRRG